ncbi:MAG: SDR family oxidoreductase [Chromatiales bacterium]|nr:SDR family oxidoreductase [Chromatiales bacterium]
MNRRELLLGGSAAIATGGLAGCGRAEVARPEGVPIGPFDADSTAEDVTAGMDLSGLTALVTGANSGLGYESMRVLALRGAHVIGTARTLEKATEACTSVPGRTTPVALELTDFDSVVACAAQVATLGVPLDILMCNAGVMEVPTAEQINGIERHFVTNHLGHFLLTRRLVPQLMAAPQGRVVVVSSGAYKQAPAAGIEFDNLSGERDYEPRKAYGQSKLANYLFVRELARRMEGTRVTANALQPGVIMTNLGRYLPWYQVVTAKLIGWTFMKSVEAGAATQVYVATWPKLAGISGYFFRDCNAFLPGGNMENDELAARLWTVSEDLTQPWLEKAT